MPMGPGGHGGPGRHGGPGGPGRGMGGPGMPPPRGGFHGRMHRGMGGPGMPPPPRRNRGCCFMPFMWTFLLIIIVVLGFLF